MLRCPAESLPSPPAFIESFWVLIREWVWILFPTLTVDVLVTECGL